MKMKNMKYITIAAICILFAACQDGKLDNRWDEPDLTLAPYGNNNIVEHNVITIAQLIAKYPNVFASTDQNALIDEDIQIKAYVTGNDIGGNLYKQIAIQDASGAIIVSINKNGLCGYLAEGQQILIDLKGLYIGGYRKQPQIGMPYNGNGIGRMSADIWMQHFKIIGNYRDINPTAILPTDFTTIQSDMNNNCSKLVTLKNVTFKDADGTATFAPKDGSVALTNNCANRELTGLGSNVVIRTSTYADFAAMKLPYKQVNGITSPAACNLTGIATRFNTTWQILIRKTSDIEVIN
jgi:hypothetical protein